MIRHTGLNQFPDGPCHQGLASDELWPGTQRAPLAQHRKGDVVSNESLANLLSEEGKA